MYYYYHNGFGQTKKLILDLNFKAEDSKSVSFEEFNEFLVSINELHKRIIILTQPEYKNKNSLNDFDSITLLSYHQLNIEHINRENPFFLKLTFNILQSYSAPYWALWKILIKICKRYGKDSSDIKETLNSIVIFLEKVYIALKIEKLDNIINSILGEPMEEKSKEEIFIDLKKMIREFLQNKNAMAIYNKFCNSIITVTDCFSYLEDIDEKINLLTD